MVKKTDRAKVFLASFIVACANFCCEAVRDALAQDPARTQEPYVTVNRDMKYYEIRLYQNNKDYIKYSQVIREKIKERLKTNYRRPGEEGDVSLFFVVESSGRLARYKVDNNSTGDKKLVDTAVLSLKESSPFPPFPKNLPDARLPFSLTVSFKEK